MTIVLITHFSAKVEKFTRNGISQFKFLYPDCFIIFFDCFQVDYLNMEMLKPHRRYMRRTFQTGLWLQYRTSAHQVQLHAKINRLQIDNQLSECVFPVILAPVPPPKSVTQSTGTVLSIRYEKLYNIDALGHFSVIKNTLLNPFILKLVMH